MDFKKALSKPVKKPVTRKAAKIPSKKTMNFVHQQRYFRPAVMIPVLLVLIIMVNVLMHFFILKPLEKKADAYLLLDSKQRELAAYQSKLVDYEELKKQYGRYSNVWMNEDELSLVDPIAVLDLIEEKIAPNAYFSNISFGGNMLSMQLEGLTLEQGSAMVDDLETSPLVKSAYIYSAVAQDAAEAQIHLTINLTREVTENDQD